MPRMFRPILILAVAALLAAASAEAAGRRGQVDPANDPLAMGMPFDWTQFDSPWGPSVFYEYGSWSPTGGTWEDMLKSGPTLSSGIRWKHADFTGDLLPPSSTYLSVGQRYAYLKDEADIQLYGPNNFVGDVGNMRLYMGEFGVTQRFIGPIRRGVFFDVGAAVDLGWANGQIAAAVPNPFDDPLFIPKRKEDGFIIRGELNTGVGLQTDWVDFKFGLATGLGGTSALSGRFHGQTDVSARISGTIFLFD
jgi:hypothetical protein